MQFSQSVSLVLLAPTMSGMKLRHLCGQSCFRICTKMMFILARKMRSARKLRSSVQIFMIRLLMYVLIPSRCSSGRAPHLNLMTSSSIYSQHR